MLIARGIGPVMTRDGFGLRHNTIFSRDATR
jgi:hypothetical protein